MSIEARISPYSPPVFLEGPEDMLLDKVKTRKRRQARGNTHNNTRRDLEGIACKLVIFYVYFGKFRLGSAKLIT